jgi:hypothetical protein
MPMALRKRKRGLGFESPSPPPSSHPRLASTSTSTTMDDPCAPRVVPSSKKSKSTWHHGDPNLPPAPSSKPEKNSKSTPTFPTSSESTLPAVTHDVQEPSRDLGFENYVSTLSGLAMAAMPAAMQAVVAADPFAAFRFAQSCFSPFAIPSPLLPTMPPFGIEHSLPTMAASSTAMIPPNDFLPLPSTNSQPVSPVIDTTPTFFSMQSNDIPASDPVTPLNPRACIGWVVQPNFPTRGIFRISPDSKTQIHWGDMHVPREECCLVMEDIPNVHRNIAFVKSWSDQFDPKPAFGVVDVVNGKSLIEFISHAAAQAAYYSPRLQGPKYGKAQHVRVFWYKPGDDTTNASDSSSSTLVQAQPKKSTIKKPQARQKTIEVGPGGTDAQPPSSASVPSHSDKRKQLLSSLLTQLPAKPSFEPSSITKKMDPTPGSTNGTNLTVAPVLTDASPVDHSALEHRSASVVKTPVISPPSVSSVSSPLEPTLKPTNSYKRPESQDYRRIAIKDTDHAKVEATIGGGSSCTVSPPSNSILTLDDLPSTQSNNKRPTISNGVTSSSSSDSAPQLESLMEQRLRLQLQAKKQLATIELALRPTIVNAIALADDNADAHMKQEVEENDMAAPGLQPVYISPPPEPTSRQCPHPSPCPSKQSPQPSLCTSDANDNEFSKDDREASQQIMASSLDNLATSFIAEILHSAREQASVPVAVEQATKVHGDLVKTVPRLVSSSTANLAEKQRVLAQRIAESKSLMNKYQAARTKEEKDKIMQLLKEQNRWVSTRRWKVDD